MSEHVHGVTRIESSGLKQPYHLVDPSPWPIIGGPRRGFCVVFGIILAAHFGSYALLVYRCDPGLRHDVLLVARRDPREPHAGTAHAGRSPWAPLWDAVLHHLGGDVLRRLLLRAFFNFALLPDTQGNGQTVWPPTHDPHVRPVPSAGS